ncbi:MAG: SprT-like domain-containing protein [Nanoarchaeota archaeon]|nr:SprT-like domain-containing protein [Nanoarchaeota archaeon]MBU1269578.1 SprT-like domain-containing protein [Nanoarchaeota archaeon]MBU1604690.1 SprT-like domain-containing protein [Nanoarchaeota archaeon]MBU2443839.1 SprT-like domain-containing protein [Nanoarchaeota archaeon]
MNIATRAFKELFPEKELVREIKLNYSAKFKPYNANVKYNSSRLTFNLSRKWTELSDDIQIGLIQGLLLKMYKEKKTTINIQLYQKFIKNISKYSRTEQVDPFLKKSFDRINEKYFFNFLETPNLVWGQESFRKLGSYEYTTNTITISAVLKDEPLLLDYVIYHEMLHKSLNFKSKNGRNYHHTTEFRNREKEFEDKDIESKLTAFLRKKRLKKLFRFF